VIATLGTLASVYALLEPSLVAVPPMTNFSGELRAEPKGGLAIWIDVTQSFKNDSWKRGGHIAGLQMVPRSLDAATWLTSNRIVPMNSENFGIKEEKNVHLNALFQFPEMDSQKRYPAFQVDIQFLDQNGAAVKRRGTNTPFSLHLNIDQAAVNSLKLLSSEDR
jgi:hypothetical protein